MESRIKLIGNIFVWIFVGFVIAVTPFFLSVNQSAENYPEIFGKLFISENQTNDLLILDRLSDEEILSLKDHDVIIYNFKDKQSGSENLMEDRIEFVVTDNLRTTFYLKENGSVFVEKSEKGLLGDEILAKADGIIIPFMGAFMSFITSSSGYIAVVVIPLVLLFVFELFNYMITALGVKKEP